LFLKRRAIPKNALLFAVEETDSLVATGTFANAVKRLRLNNIEFDPVELV
jgi:hypothetical protein